MSFFDEGDKNDLETMTVFFLFLAVWFLASFGYACLMMGVWTLLNYLYYSGLYKFGISVVTEDTKDEEDV